MIGPVPTPETRPFWDGAENGTLVLPLCYSCGRHYFYPRPHCRYCGSAETGWAAVCGRGTLASYIIVADPAPGHEEHSPVIALIDLEEGPRLLSNIVGIEPVPAQLELDMPLEVRFELRGKHKVPVFAPETQG